MGELGERVLRDSLAQLARWRAVGLSFATCSLSVNVASQQLVDDSFIDVVAGALGETGIDAGSLWLEITETALMADTSAATRALRGLRGLGLHLAVDDFGTGYSSLTYLKRFPVEAIKVDRSFVTGLGLEADDTSIVEAVVRLGHSLGLIGGRRGCGDALATQSPARTRLRPRPGLPLRPPPPRRHHRIRTRPLLIARPHRESCRSDRGRPSVRLVAGASLAAPVGRRRTLRWLVTSLPCGRAGRGSWGRAMRHSRRVRGDGPRGSSTGPG